MQVENLDGTRVGELWSNAMRVKMRPGSLWIRPRAETRVEVAYGGRAEIGIEAVSEGGSDGIRCAKNLK